MDSIMLNSCLKLEGLTQREDITGNSGKEALKDVKKYFYENRLVDIWDKLSEVMMNVAFVTDFKKLYYRKLRLRYGAINCRSLLNTHTHMDIFHKHTH